MIMETLRDYVQKIKENLNLDLDAQLDLYIEAKEILNQMKQALEFNTSQGLKEGKRPTKFTYVYPKMVYDEEKIALVATSHNINLDEFTTMTPTINYRKLGTFMVEHHIEVPFKERAGYVRKI